MNVFEEVKELNLNGFDVIAELNATSIGLVRFSDKTPWERHDSEELLIILDGDVEVIVEGTAPVVLTAGDLVVVPANTWHRQIPLPEVALLFATEMNTTTHKPL